jgi:hypothetical protein
MPDLDTLAAEQAEDSSLAQAVLGHERGGGLTGLVVSDELGYATMAEALAGLMCSEVRAVRRQDPFRTPDLR